MKIRRKSLVVAAFILVAVLVIPAVQQIRSERRVQALLSDGGVIVDLAPPSREEEVAFYQGQLRLNVLGGESGSVLPTAEVTTFLHHSSTVVQLQALHLLGRFEDPEALPALREKVQSEPFSLAAKIALARVEARDLRGRAKLEAIANKIGLSWNEVLLLSQRANDSYWPGYSSGDRVLDEMVDVICSMEERGEPIETLANVVLPSEGPHSSNRSWRAVRLSFGRVFLLDPTQLARIQAAPLPEGNEIRFLLDYLGKLEGLRGQECGLMEYIAGLGPQVPSQIVAKLEEIAQHPHRYYGLKPSPGSPGFFRSKYGLHAIMQACWSVLDPQVIDKLQQMETRPLPIAVRSAARETSIWMRERIANMASQPPRM